jgi:hypothetical protein
MAIPDEVNGKDNIDTQIQPSQRVDRDDNRRTLTMFEYRTVGAAGRLPL